MGKYRIETEDGHAYEIETEDQNPPIASPKLPPELQGPPPSGLRQAIQNIPSSALHAITSPYAPGMPSGNPQFEGDYHGPTPESIGEEVKGLIPHPIDDPVGTALQLATLGKFRRPIVGAGKGAVRGATEMVPLRRHGVGLDVPAPVAGASLGGFAGWASHLPHGSEIGAAIGAAAPIVKGAVGGIREALADPEARFIEDSARPSAPVGEAAPIVKSPIKPSVTPEEAIQPPTFKNRPGVNNEPVFQPPNVTPPNRTPLWKSPQEAASHNDHLPTVTQADEFGKMPVTPPNPIAPQVQPPAGNAPAPIAPNPAPIVPPANLKVSGGETPSGPEIIRPGTPPPGEKLIPSEKELSKIEKAFKEQDDAHQKTMKLIEEFKKKHPTTKKP